ncbi:transposase [Legionella feeleii]|uniref:Transposase n=1 Tax=Legionella feeleii TaxID=453 RepID=A0A0W0TWS0_9GAMM|nr:transposase [Legionella feeleii]
MTRNKYAEFYNQMKEEMEQQYFKETLYQRMWKLEGVMNELKNYHDLKRIIGPAMKARELPQKKTESGIGTRALNQMTLLGMTASVQVQSG